MATKKAVEINEEVEINQEAETVEAPAQALVFNRYRIEGVGNDAIVYERIAVPREYAEHKGVKEFVDANGKITYYVEKQVKKYSENVVTA